MPHPQRLDDTVGRFLAISAGPVQVGLALGCEITRGQIRAAVAAGALLTLRRGIVVPTVLWQGASLGQRRTWALAAALTAYPGAFASHATAAWLHGLPDFRAPRIDGPGVPPTHVTRLGAAREDGWLRVHGCDTPADRVTLIDGSCSTDLVRTSIEVAATRSLSSAAVFIDAAMRRAVYLDVGAGSLRDRVLDPDHRALLRRRWRDGLVPYAGRRWVTRVRAAVDLADPAAESVLESISRVEVIEAGLPAPRCGVPLQGDDGRWYWVDMLWDDQRVIGEADGALKYAEPGVLLAEKRRQEALEGRGYRFVRWGWGDAYPDSAVMIGRIRRALAGFR